MVKSASILAVFTLALLAIIGCGGTSMNNSTRVMQSLAVTPSSADAQTFPNGQVQFTATGTFNMAPMTVMSPPVVWTVNMGSMSPMPMSMSMSMKASAMSSGQPSITNNGLAQCNGSTGIVTIQATAPADPNIPISQMSNMMAVVSGMAQMTCP